jgi:carbamoylphosphate synthase large subunit
MKKKIRIAIGAIGSGVGESIIDSCRLSGLPLHTIGFGTNPYAYGAYDCDERVFTSSIYDLGYSEEILHLCIQNGIDIYIPGLDDEALLLSSKIEDFENQGIGIIVFSRPLLEIARDKKKMCWELSRISGNFVKSYTQEELREGADLGTIHFPLIAKPRSSFASRGIFIIRSQQDLSWVTDNHIVQELAIPCSTDPNRDLYLREITAGRNLQISEISVQIVVDRRQELLGKTATCNKLNNGVPIEITPYDNSEVWQVIDKLLPTFLELGLRGPLNIQGRLTDNGFRIFEMNARFTGITGLRAIMGFN